jgi:protein subunit release factor A
VRLTDLITGLSAECREERRTPDNEARAFRKLVEKMVAYYRSEEISLFAKEEAAKGSIRTYNVKRNEAKDHRTGKTYPLDEILNGELDRMLEELLTMRARLDG